METLYRKVAVSERLPEKPSFNFIKYTCGSTDSAFFSIKENKFYARRKDIEFWLEEIHDPTAQLKADKAELLEALENLTEYGSTGEDAVEMKREIESLIQKHKQ